MFKLAFDEDLSSEKKLIVKEAIMQLIRTNFLENTLARIERQSMLLTYEIGSTVFNGDIVLRAGRLTALKDAVEELYTLTN